MTEKCYKGNCKHCSEINSNHGASHLHGSGTKLICTHPDLEKKKVIVNDLYEWMGYGGSTPVWCPGYEEEKDNISLSDALVLKGGLNGL